MAEFLVFGLAASLGSFGELAGHERRGGLSWPARSALIGLMGAALGIRRDGDFSALEALKLTVGIYDSGQFLRDYHTIETVPSPVLRQANSRPEALRIAGTRSTTSITLRDYRSGVFYGIAAEGPGLSRIAAALNAPVFTLYLGRKSCPLAAPPGARIVAAESSEAAMGQIIQPPWRAPIALQAVVREDPEEGEIVHDVALDRQRWHFGPRRVSLRRPMGGAQ